MRFFLRALPIAPVILLGAAIIFPCGSSAQHQPDISQSLNNMADQPATHLGIVFDRSMLQAARSVLESGGMSSERAAAALTSVSFDNYRYPLPAAYVPGTMSSIIAAYRSGGWKHLVDAHGGALDPYTGVAEKGATTDLWLHFTGTDIDGLTVLTRASRNMTVVQVACDLRPLDLIHLSGHFGIPKVDPGAVMVPAPDNR
jgi:hypothetical protein